MVLFDRKKALNQILGPKEGAEPEHEDPSHTVAKEAIDAVHAKDHVGFANAMKAMHMHHASESDKTGYHEDGNGD